MLFISFLFFCLFGKEFCEICGKGASSFLASNMNSVPAQSTVDGSKNLIFILCVCECVCMAKEHLVQRITCMLFDLAFDGFKLKTL